MVIQKVTLYDDAPYFFFGFARILLSVKYCHCPQLIERSGSRVNCVAGYRCWHVS
jgi:hypothetical protein